MVHSLSSANHDLAAAVAARRIQQTGHQDIVCAQQVVLTARRPSFVPVVGLDGVARLLDFAQRGHDRLAVEQGGHLAFAQRVPLDRQGALYRTDAVDAPQPEILSDAGSLGPPDSLADPFDQGHYFRGDPVWWILVHLRSACCGRHDTVINRSSGRVLDVGSLTAGLGRVYDSWQLVPAGLAARPRRGYFCRHAIC